MKNMSLKWKIYIVGLIPFIFFLGSMLLSISKELSLYNEATSLKSKIEVIKAASAVVHESQKERGKSAGYLNGRMKIELLNNQRAINDKKIVQLRDSVKVSTFDDSYKKEIIAELNKYELLRESITSKKITLEKALETYSNIISRFLKIELDIASSTTNHIVSEKLKGFRILEDAKESGGKLRAKITSVLAKNKPISDKEFETLIRLKAGVDEGVKSSGLILDKKSIEYILKFKNSKEWATVNGTFQTILKNSDKGNFYQDSKEFFLIITDALNIIRTLITHQKDGLVDTINEVKKNSVTALWQTSLIITFLVVGLFFFVSYMSASITKKIRIVINSLRENSGIISTSSQEISNTSTQLSEASTEQASSLQETVSSINEISSMVQRNADSAEQSTSTSKKSKEEASRGKESIDEMILSIAEIAKSNEEVMSEMEKNNEQINKIINVISEIGEKTKVINDIVFQTKLLSFNASVEAARAGEHGKGFSVVAEEVGNLAAMSGKAALEISQMLDSSIKQVNDIVDSSKGKVERLVSQGKEKVDRGTVIAHSCSDVLEGLVRNVDMVNEMVNEISTASSEQATGVREITSAMQQLDQVTHQNTTASQKSASMASQLRNSSQNLNNSVNELSILVDGEKSTKLEPLPDDNNVVQILHENEKKSQFSEKPHLKMASGSELSIPDENDSRFEDL